MFSIGDYIVYGTKGVCLVTDVTTMNLDGVPKDTKYYILQPWNQSGSRIFVSVENKKTLMRKTLSKTEADELIDEIPCIDEIWVDGDKLREEKYKECLRSCDCRELVRIIKTLFLRKEERLKAGKKITTTDERYLRLAEEHLYSELSLALEIPVEHMRQYITDRVENTKIL